MLYLYLATGSFALAATLAAFALLQRAPEIASRLATAAVYLSLATAGASIPIMHPAGLLALLLLAVAIITWLAAEAGVAVLILGRARDELAAFLVRVA